MATNDSTPTIAFEVGGDLLGHRAATGANVHIRPFASVDECHVCVELQREVWGHNQPNIAPASLLQVVTFVGGISLGAFDDDGALLGFIFGVSGIRDGELAHWSHMLGVREAARDMGIGRMLKEHQRSTLAGLGVARIFWTFDPLMAKNAYFNLNRLGAAVVKYAPDMYGPMTSPLHLGLPTDRLIVCLTTTSPEVPPLTLPRDEDLPVLTAFPQLGDHALATADARPPILLLEMPSDIAAETRRDHRLAARWRFSLREYFQWALHNRYSPRGVRRSVASGRCFYVMVRDT